MNNRKKSPFIQKKRKQKFMPELVNALTFDLYLPFSYHFSDNRVPVNTAFDWFAKYSRLVHNILHR